MTMAPQRTYDESGAPIEPSVYDPTSIGGGGRALPSWSQTAYQAQQNYDPYAPENYMPGGEYNGQLVPESRPGQYIDVGGRALGALTTPVVQGRGPVVDALTRPANYLFGLGAAPATVAGELGSEALTYALKKPIESLPEGAQPFAEAAAGVVGGLAGAGVGSALERGVKGALRRGASEAIPREIPAVSEGAFGESADEAARLDAITKAREQHYGGQPAGQVLREPITDIERARIADLPPLSADEIASGNNSAIQRSLGDTSLLDPNARLYSPRENLLQRIADAKPLMDVQTENVAALRRRQAGAFAGVAENGAGGTAGMRQAMAAMRGQAEQATFEPLRPIIGEAGENALNQAVLDSHIQPFGKAQAGSALDDILSGRIPTPSALSQLEQVFPGVTAGLRTANVLPKEPWFKRAMDIAADVANTPRSIMASGDLSATFRQAFKAAPSHPGSWVQAMKDQVAAYKNPETAQGVMDRIYAHPLADYLDRAGVDILPIKPGELGQREEAFMSRLAGKVPLVERSQTAYTTGMNSMRSGVFYDIIGNLSPEQIASMKPQQLENIGRFVNALTGRGSIPQALEKYQPELNALFFSPRNTFGTVQANLAMLSRDPIVRKEAAKSMLSFYATGAGILGLAKVAGLDVGVVPGSADFGKITLPGGTKLDIWGGNAQLFRLIANLTTGKATTAGGTQYDQDRAETVLRFLRSKLAPVPGEAVTAITGENGVGQAWKTSDLLPDVASKEPGDALRMLTPLFFQDLYDAARSSGTQEGAEAGLGSFFGVGIQPNTSASGRTRQGQYDELTPTDQVEALGPQSWRTLADHPQLPQALQQLAHDYPSHSDWAQALRTHYAEAYEQQGYTKANALTLADRAVSQHPLEKAYAQLKNGYEARWIAANPHLAEQILEDDTKKPPSERRLSPSNADRNAIQAGTQ